MISFIVPFSTIEKGGFLNLNEKKALWEENDFASIMYSTLKTIKNINNLNCEKEIILVDNSHTWPGIKLPNLRVVKGWQALPVRELKNTPEYMNHKDVKSSLKNIGNLTMWVSMAFHCGIQEAKGDYIVLQHNDTFYHKDRIDEIIEQMEEEKLEYISVDNKKIWISTYLLNKKFLDKHIKNYSAQIIQMRPENGGYLKTKKLGFADAYFFLTKRKFFDNYNIDWRYGDTNHGATIYCLENDLKYLHLGPYHDNPNWDIKDIDSYSPYTGRSVKETLHTYYYKKEPFLTHLKGGFSENKMSRHFGNQFDEYLKELKNAK